MLKSKTLLLLPALLLSRPWQLVALFAPASPIFLISTCGQTGGRGGGAAEVRPTEVDFLLAPPSGVLCDTSWPGSTCRSRPARAFKPTCWNIVFDLRSARQAGFTAERLHWALEPY